HFANLFLQLVGGRAVDIQLGADGIADRTSRRTVRCIVGEQKRLSRPAQRLDTLEVMWTHRQNQIRRAYDIAREGLRLVHAEVHVALHADEERAVTRRRAIVSARARARGFDVVESALDRDFARDRFRQRTTARIARADEQDLHSLTRLRSDWER